jgi:hypothetical protein
MMTENGGIAEVTEAAERMATIPPLSRENKTFNHRGRRFHRGKAQRRTGNIFLCGFSLCASVLSAVRILPFRC